MKNKLINLLAFGIILSPFISCTHSKFQNYKENSKIITAHYYTTKKSCFYTINYVLNEKDNIVDVAEVYYCGEKKPFKIVFDINKNGEEDYEDLIILDPNRNGEFIWEHNNKKVTKKDLENYSKESPKSLKDFIEKRPLIKELSKDN